MAYSGQWPPYNMTANCAVDRDFQIFHSIHYHMQWFGRELIIRLYECLIRSVCHPMINKALYGFYGYRLRPCSISLGSSFCQSYGIVICLSSNLYTHVEGYWRLRLFTILEMFIMNSLWEAWYIVIIVIFWIIDFVGCVSFLIFDFVQVNAYYSYGGAYYNPQMAHPVQFQPHPGSINYRQMSTHVNNSETVSPTDVYISSAPEYEASSRPGGPKSQRLY